MSKGRTRPPSQRQLRVGEELRHALAGLLDRDEVHDPAVRGVSITITEVRASPDLKNATAYVMPLGGDADEMARVITGLSRAAPYLRRRLAEKVRLRYSPNITFAPDTTFENAGRIDSLLRDPAVARDLRPPETDDGS